MERGTLMFTAWESPAKVIDEQPKGPVRRRRVPAGVHSVIGDAVRDRYRQQIAIVGIASRLPGASGPDEFWDLLRGGVDATRDRDRDRLCGPDHGGFVDGADDFDAGFFRLGPREAAAADPQQRLALELAWHGLEDAGIVVPATSVARIGVFLGVMAADYADLVAMAGTAGITRHTLTGVGRAMVANRISHTLRLSGPSMTVDTGQSSSLVAVHLACESLRSAEADIALAGGIHLNVSPLSSAVAEAAGVLSPDGTCYVFDERANGYVRGEGGGIVVLKPLARAIEDGDRIYAVIMGSAVGAGTGDVGLTVPSVTAQARTIGEALDRAGVRPAGVQYVELHGTGTRVGDPVEAQALGAAYGRLRPDTAPLVVGSVKTNIGHLEGAAGIAGLIKTALCIDRRELVPSLHFSRPNPRIALDELGLRVAASHEPWPAAEQPIAAGISSFGIGGTCCHMVLTAAPTPTPTPSLARPGSDGRDGPSRVLPVLLPVLLSGHDEVALRAQAGRLREHLLARPELTLADVAFSAATTRAHLAYRAAVTASGRDDLLAGLGALAADEPGPWVVTGEVAAGRTAFMFSGQGAQRPGMGMELAASHPVFAQALEEVCAHLDPLLGRSLQDLLAAPEGSEQAALLDQTQFTQAGLFAVEVALYRLVESLGVHPEFLIGHSVGELAAAHVAGVLSLADACVLVAARGQLMGALPAGGAMAAVQATEEEVIASLDRYAGRLAVAAVNGPQAVVVSGDEAALTEWLPQWADRKTSRLRVSHAFHSPLMDPMLAEFAEVARGLRYGEPRIPVVSNLTGTVAAAELADPEYWVSHVRQPVRFAAGIGALAGLGVTRFYELGPDAVLTAMARGVLGDDTGTVLAPALRARHPEPETFAGFLGQAHAAGTGVDWAAFYAGTGARPVPLPTYAFQRQRYWLSPSTGATDPAAAGQGRVEHPLLVAAVPVGDRDEWLFTGRLSLEAQPWLADHAVLGTVIVPGAVLTELTLTAGRHVGCPVVEELVLEAPLLLPEGTVVQLQVTVAEAEPGDPDDPHGRRAVAIYTRPQPGPDEDLPETTCHARGTVALDTVPLAPAASPFPAAWPPPGARAVPVEALYARLADMGYDYGPVFQGVRAAWQDGERVYAEVALPADHAATAPGFGLHPALLDAALHGGVDRLDRDDESSVQLPFSWAGVRLGQLIPGQLSPGQLRVLVTPVGPGTLRIDLAGPRGEFVASVDQLVFRPVRQAQLDQAGRPSNGSLFRVDWNPVPAAPHGGTARPRVASLGEPARGAEWFADLDALEQALAAGAPVPDLVLAPVAAVPSPDGVAAAAQAVAEHTLALLQGWLASVWLADARLVVVTHRAIAAGDSDPQPPDLTQAPVWGLVRCAQSEHPGRFGLIDLDGHGGDPDWGALTGLDEPQLAVRQGRLLAPRLARMPAAAGDQLAPPQSDGTVLITGGTGGLGAILARHLATTGWAKRLLLVSRRGLDAAGAPELVEDLTALGCAAQVAACDVADADQLKRLLKSLEHPLTAVIHAAGLLDDGVIESLTPQQLDRVMRPKVHGALNLHELTADTELAAFVLFSSVSAVLGSPGQGNYAAANAVLDALASMRRAEGLSGSSLAWGLWADTGGMAGQLDETGLARFRRMGVEPLSTDLGLELFDQAQRLNPALLVPARLDLASLRARAGTVPALLRGLVRAPARRTEAEVPLAQRLADVQEAEREQLVLLLVQTQVAAVIGHTSPGMIDPGRAFKDLGFDSLTAVEFRNRLMQASGVRLPPTLVFDHPTSAAVTQLLLSEAGASAAEPSIDRELARLEDMLATIATDEKQRVAGRLRSILAAITDGGWRTSERIEAATSMDEVFQLIDAEFSEA
jgi:acyl transferase domain-containing protein